MINYYTGESIITLLAISVVICGVSYLFGSKSINKIPNEDLRGRLLKSLDYIYLMLFCFFVMLMKFQSLYFLSAPNEFQSSAVRDLQNYQSIQSLQIAHTSFYVASLSSVMTSYFLLRKALK